MQTEVFPLTLFAIGGMMVFPAANDLLTMFVALEVLSLPLYLMCGLARRRRLLSQEAAVKYFLLGAFASAFFLYGLALLYGYAGSVRARPTSPPRPAGPTRSDALLFGGLALLVVGLLFKAPSARSTPGRRTSTRARRPRSPRSWPPAPRSPRSARMLRVLHVALRADRWEWRPVLWAVAIVSMVIGAVIGLTQTDVKRMLAYSSIAHAGFLLVGAIALTDGGPSGTLFYLLTYGFTTLAAFG